ncbi:LPXTG cell wall anchor domain-containing protein [Isoptericola aurantiacus]|uniref:LPXTG cell wall anchor domain-containing protein n=1 Tax=Isoptericola aurantiacus TaxID=3377839 RepID=UPI00383ABFCF
MSLTRLRAPLAMLAAFALLMLGAVVGVPGAVASGTSNDIVCDTAGGVKYEESGGTFHKEGSSGPDVEIEVVETKGEGEPIAVVATAPDGYLIDAYCVKASGEKLTQDVDPDAPSVRIETPATNKSGKPQAISHLVVTLVEEPDDFDWDWEYPAPTCDGTLTVTYPDDLPSGQANDVNITVQNLESGEVATINIHREGGTWSGQQVFDPTTEPEWPTGWTSWAILWTQVAGTNYHWEGYVEVGCDAPEEPVEEPVEASFEADVEPAVCVDGEIQGGSFAYAVTVGSEHGTRSFQVKGLGDGTGGTAETYYRADGTTGDAGEIVVFANVGAGEEATLSLDDLPPGDYRVVSDGSRTVKDQYRWDFTIASPQDCGLQPAALPSVDVTQAQCTPQEGVHLGQQTTAGGVVVADAQGLTVVVTGASGETVADPLDLPAGDYRVEVTLEEGFAWGEDVPAGWAVGDGSVTYAFTIAPLADCWEELSATPVEPTVIDVCGSEDDEVVLPEVVGLTYSMWDAPNGDVRVKVVAEEGYYLTHHSQHDESVKWYTFTLDPSGCEPEPTPEPSEEPTVEPTPATLAGSVAVGECVADAPWIGYEIVLDDPEGQAVADENGQYPVYLVLTDGTNEATIALGVLGEDATLTGRALWPGASVAEDGVTATGWPGWTRLADGSWAQTDQNYAWTRGDIDARLVVNPEVQVDLSYPDATPECANPPAAEDDEVREQETVVDTSPSPVVGEQVAADTDALPQTGSNVVWAAIGALVLIGAGGAVLWLRRRA